MLEAVRIQAVQSGYSSSFHFSSLVISTSELGELVGWVHYLILKSTLFFILLRWRMLLDEVMRFVYLLPHLLSSMLN